VAPIKDPFDSLDTAMESLDRAMEKLDDIMDGDFDSINIKVDGVRGHVANTIQKIFKEKNNFSPIQRKQLLKSITDVGKSVKVEAKKGNMTHTHSFTADNHNTNIQQRSKRAENAFRNLVLVSIFLALFLFLITNIVSHDVTSQTPPALTETIPPSSNGEADAPEDLNKL